MIIFQHTTIHGNALLVAGMVKIVTVASSLLSARSARFAVQQRAAHRTLSLVDTRQVRTATRHQSQPLRRAMCAPSVVRPSP